MYCTFANPAALRRDRVVLPIARPYFATSFASTSQDWPWGPANSRSSARGRISLRRSGRIDELRQQDSRAQEPDHDDPVPQHPTTGAPSRDGEARRESAACRRGEGEEDRREIRNRCTAVAHCRRIRTSLCAGFRRHSHPLATSFLAVRVWCGRGDSNPHDLAIASPSSWCVCKC
jgi:hypothetical protein